MSIIEPLSGPILETVLDRLTLLFLNGAAGNQIAARQAAAQMLVAHNPRTSEELCLAANIISFGFHALDALAQAVTPDMPLAKVLRLRGSAVSLSRESHKAARRLSQLQAINQTGTPVEIKSANTEPRQPEVNVTNVTRVEQPSRDTQATATNAAPNATTWTRAYEQRRRDQRIAASLVRAEARVTAKALATMPAGRAAVVDRVA